MSYANVILSKRGAETGSKAAEGMVNMAIVEVCNTEQSLRRLQGYQEGISRLNGSGQGE